MFCPADGQQLYSATQVPVAATDQDSRIGSVLAGRYQFRRVVADGGMGRVYEALDLQERRACAVKILHPDVVADAISVERFKREFEVSKLLPHRFIVEVMDFKDTPDGSYALIMEFLYGEELRATLKREGVLHPARIVRVLSQVAIGLDEAHARKLVHRDLKPDNLFLCQTSDGDIVKILDFGSAKDKADNAKKLTVMGTTIGSPYYMAPEQAQGLETLDHRADVWAMAAIVYEAITGEVPFKGNNGPSILLEILTKEPKPASVLAQQQKFPVPPSVDRVLSHAFKKSAATRIPSLGALADAIGQAYGLSGNHDLWANTSEAELRGQIDAAMDRLLAAPIPARPRADASDAFFGETGALDTMGDPFAQAAPAAPAGSMAPTVRSAGAPPPDAMQPDYASEIPLVIPKSRATWLIPVVVGALALAVGVIVVLVAF